MQAVVTLHRKDHLSGQPRPRERVKSKEEQTSSSFFWKAFLGGNLNHKNVSRFSF
jgi:hypothetical protein